MWHVPFEYLPRLVRNCGRGNWILDRRVLGWGRSRSRTENGEGRLPLHYVDWFRRIRAYASYAAYFHGVAGVCLRRRLALPKRLLAYSPALVPQWRHGQLSSEMGLCCHVRRRLFLSNRRGPRFS